MAKGFIDTVTDSVDVAAKAVGFDKHFKAMPINQDDGVDKINSIKDFERYLRDSGGFSRRVAAALSSRGKVVLQGDPEPPPTINISELLTVVSRFKVPESL